MSQTIAFLHAEMDRANQMGARSINITLLDLKEILGQADAYQRREKAEKAKTSVGWGRPGSLFALREGKKRHVRISRRKSVDFCVELFIGDNLGEKQREVDVIHAIAASEVPHG
ncbi:hypothetical protein [Agrobacterium tumefaciens]|uniref:hypothetical protein n=1 Tax=Agrobacterium tumefaciens TaxID=358 RepID=UPI0015717FC4|nr:hypothetical protein [Agrobacterium tumefaciens]